MDCFGASFPTVKHQIIVIFYRQCSFKVSKITIVKLLSCSLGEMVWESSDMTCSISRFIGPYFTHMSGYTLALVSVDRFCAIWVPHKVMHPLPR